jgi:prolyl 4-hydroxylase
MHKEILHDYPLVEKYNNFLSHAECRTIIDFARPRLVPGTVIADDGNPVLDYKHRNASTIVATALADLSLNETITNRVADLLGIDAGMLERMAIINYATSQEFKTHQDYFVDIENDQYKANNLERCRKGGNRIATAIIYLNNVESGGETYFPWLDTRIDPVEGTLVHFQYGYPEWEANVRSQHAGMPVLSGEKWIIALWVRETSVLVDVPDYRKFELESSIYSRVSDVDYELTVGPGDDRQLLKISLPANTDPMNTLVVGFTGGMDSSLLLYLLGMCNNSQVIPYKIQPVCVTSKLCVDEAKIEENWKNVELMASLITQEVGGNILQLHYISAPKFSKRATQPTAGLKRYFDASGDFSSQRFYKYKNIYTGSNAAPLDTDVDFKLTFTRPSGTIPLPWILPFMDLQKYHIVDALLQLGLEHIIENTVKCNINHVDLLDTCESFACNERRWAFTKINRDDIGIKHFINKGHIMKANSPQIKPLIKPLLGKVTTKPVDMNNRPALGPAPVVGGPSIG